MQYQRQCICCGNKYSYCPGCSEFKGQPTWRLTFDTDECRTLYKVFESYSAKTVSAEEAKNMIDKMNLSNGLLDKIHPILKKNLNEINEKTKVVVVKEKPTIIEEEPQPKKERRNSRKNRRVEETVLETPIEVVEETVVNELVNDIVEE